jgi:feruloyl esterase
MDTSDPDLRPFQARGGKIISWHGLADKVIPPNGTLDYYKRVQAISPDVRDFYRYLEAPGVAHCAGGKGPFPLKAFESLVKWVEEGVAPDVLDTQSMSVAAEGEGVDFRRPLCPWPKVAAFLEGGREPGRADSFVCRDRFNETVEVHDEL